MRRWNCSSIRPSDPNRKSFVLLLKAIVRKFTLDVIPVNPMQEESWKTSFIALYRVYRLPSTARTLQNQSKILASGIKKVTAVSIQRFPGNGPHYPEDIALIIISVFEKEIQLPEIFQLFPYFGPRFRQLKTYLDAQQPRTFLQFWRDERDDGS